MPTSEVLPRMTPYGARYHEPTTLGAKARAKALGTIRSGGERTAGLRSDPDYLIIGSKRGGTTSLARWLLEHPDVLPLFPARETRKGTYFFDVNYDRGAAWYRSHFPTRMAKARREAKTGRHTIVGEATPYYLHHPHAPIRARRHAPHTKVIAILRDPVDRAHSHWMERVRNGVETLEFAEAIEAEAMRLAGEEARMLADPSYVSFAHQHFSYIDQGRYSRGLRRWYNAFPTDQILVVRSEDLYDRPAATYGQVTNFLGLAPHTLVEFSAWNMKPKPMIDPAVRTRLVTALASDVAAVESMLGRSMSWAPSVAADDAAVDQTVRDA